MTESNFILLLRGTKHFYAEWANNGSNVFNGTINMLVNTKSIRYITSGMARTAEHDWFIELDANDYSDVLAITKVMQKENLAEHFMIIERLGDLSTSTEIEGFTEMFQEKLRSTDKIFHTPPADQAS